MEQLQEMPSDFERVLAVVAHPDDLEYGAASAVAAWTDAGKTVVYVLVTRGEAGIDTIEPERCGPLREAEQIEAARRVGVEKVEFLGFQDGVIEHSLELRRAIAGAIRRHRPELVVTLNHHDTWFGTHWNSPDHRNTGRAVFDAVGDAGNRWIFPELTDQGLQPWSGVRWVAVSGSAHATHAVAVEATLARAIASLEAHATYLAGLGGEMADPRTFLTDAAKVSADQFGGRLASTFELL
jgi:LmbE family N-acetylglucosaminyl deacetylase